MPRPKKKKNDHMIRNVAAGGSIVLVIAIIGIAWVLPVLQAVDNPLMSLIGEELTEEEVLDNPQVTVKIYCKKFMARTASDQNIDIYNYNMEYVETVTTSSSVATLSYMFHTEQKLFVQGRQAAPGTADPYVTPIQEFTVPTADAGDTVSLGTLWVYDVTGTAATFGVQDIANNDISDNSQYFFNTTDTAFKVSLSTIDSNTVYGMEDFTDYQTDRSYLGGLWLVWKGTVGQSFAADYVFSDGTNVYYVFWIANTLIDDANVPTDDTVSATIATAGGAALVADATVVLDCYDGMWLINGDVSSVASFMDTKSVTAITTKVA